MKKKTIHIESRKLTHKETTKKKARKREHISKTCKGYSLCPEHCKY